MVWNRDSMMWNRVEWNRDTMKWKCSGTDIRVEWEKDSINKTEIAWYKRL